MSDQEAGDEVPELQPKGADEATAEMEPKARLEDLVAQATAKYAVKDYRNAAELYSRGTELQAELNGEMSTENADLLYQYGRCLYHVAVMNSDVLGTKVAGEKAETGSKKSIPDTKNGESSQQPKTDPVTEEMVAAVVTEKDDSMPAADGTSKSKPFFQFTGDENFDDPEDEDAAGEGEEGPADGEEEDDFSNAFEVLDLARVLLQRRLEEVEQKEDEEGKGKGKSKSSSHSDSPNIKHIKERLSDTYDLQAEICLENEQFPNAANDLRQALALKKELYPEESSMIAEAHYKLSLALEFSSVTHQKDAEGNDDDANSAPHVDEAMREDAAEEMEAAIRSCKLRVEKEEKALAAAEEAEEKQDPKKAKATRANIKDVKDMIQDMQTRVAELRQPPVSLNDPKGTGSLDGAIPLSGILGSILGESPAEQKARIEEATKGATDVTNLVKRKKAGPGEVKEVEKKRKAEAEAEEGGAEDNSNGAVAGKRAKVEDA